MCLETTRAACRSCFHYCTPHRPLTKSYGLGAIFLSWISLVVIRSTLTAHRYVDGILKTVLLPFLLQYPGFIFQQDNAKQHTTRFAMNCFPTYETLPWPSRSPDPSPIKHVWDMMGRRMHLPGNVDDLARQLEQFWQKIPQEILSLYVTLCGSLHTG
ncbi:transposable element Tc1 transposase [Trichonephila clavipes]|nr:transposable element Tc1 transposase [Trichonephila clavipes]